jgi:tripartite-type tricarboxylate transporter receptor subunit TctC
MTDDKMLAKRVIPGSPRPPGRNRPNAASSIIPGTAALLAALLSFAAAAQTYPVKPVRLIVGPGPGSGTDVVARAIALRLTERMGQSVIVDNRVGAGGTIAVATVAKSPADGYTLLFVSGSLVIHPSIYRKLPYDVERDLAPITLVGVVPQVLVVHPSLPAKSMREFLALAKKRPGEINYGSGGVGSTGHLAGELLQSNAGIKLVHVPYKGAGPAAVDVMAGQIQGLFTSAVNALQHARTGKVRMIGVTTSKRAAAIPEVPTFAESGVPDYELMTWYGVLAPAGTPRAVIDRVNQEVAGVIKLPDVQSRLVADGIEPSGNSPEQFAALIKRELARIARIIKTANIQVE